jgi:putative endonuclease
MGLFSNLLSKAPTPPPAPPITGNKGTGALGEEIAVNFLIARSYQILVRNFRCKGGEVDIIARDPDDKSLVFIEVKARRGLSYGVPQLAVTPFKQRQISKAALTWLSKKRMHDQNARFDVIAILLDVSGLHKVEHIRNAFDLAY